MSNSVNVIMRGVGSVFSLFVEEDFTLNEFRVITSDLSVEADGEDITEKVGHKFQRNYLRDTMGNADTVQFNHYDRYVDFEFHFTIPLGDKPFDPSLLKVAFCNDISAFEDGYTTGYFVYYDGERISVEGEEDWEEYDGGWAQEYKWDPEDSWYCRDCDSCEDDEDFEEDEDDEESEE